LGKLPFRFNGLRDETSGVRLDQHQFKNVDLFIFNPTSVELLQVAAQLLQYILRRQVDAILNDAIVHLANEVLDETKLLKKLSPGLQNLWTEDVLLTVDPKVRKAFLGRVQNLSEIAQRPLFIEHFVGF
jgi:hypothetical protein